MAACRAVERDSQSPRKVPAAPMRTTGSTTLKSAGLSRSTTQAAARALALAVSSLMHTAIQGRCQKNSPTKAPTMAPGASITALPDSSEPTMLLTTMQIKSVPRLLTFVSSTTSSTATMRFLATSASGLMPPPARAMTMAESLAAAAKTPMKTRSEALRLPPSRARRPLLGAGIGSGVET